MSTTRNIIEGIKNVTSEVATKTNPVFTGNGITIPVLTSDPSGAVAGQMYYNSTDKAVKNYDGTSWSLMSNAKLGTIVNPAKNAKQIMDSGQSTGDGLYWLTNDNINFGIPFQAYCDMTYDGGGWILILTARGDDISYMGWDYSNILLRNSTAPSLNLPYSILNYSDKLKNSGGTWEWYVEAADDSTTKRTWGGHFRANVSNYSMISTSSAQTNITAIAFWNVGGFIENDGIGSRVPYLGSSTANSIDAILTTHPGSGSWWGTLVQSNINYSTFHTGPWISGNFQSPNFKRVWIR